MTLYEELLFAGIEIDHHESDLYFPVSPQTTEILKRHHKAFEIATYFINQINYQTWYEVPFNFQPFWEQKANDVIMDSKFLNPSKTFEINCENFTPVESRNQSYSTISFN